MEMSMVVWVLAATLAAAFFTIRGRNGSATRSATSNNLSTQKVYTKSEVAWHNKRTDCWIIIKDKVYDVTSYVEEHPGGDSILAHAGDDSTEGFYGSNEQTVQEMLDLAVKYNKAVQEEDRLPPEKLAIANVGIKDAKKDLEEHVANLMSSNVVQTSNPRHHA